MKKEFILDLEFPGFVLFDPYNFEDFVIKNNISDSNIIEYFTNNEKIGDCAFQEGFVLPIYSILEEKYNIIIDNDYIEEETDLFYYKSFPLKITNQKLVISDISALLDWEANVFQNIPNDKNLFLQYATFIENGNYLIDIIGYYKDNVNFGFKLILNKVDNLPVFDISGSIDSYDFNVIKKVNIGNRIETQSNRKV